MSTTNQIAAMLFPLTSLAAAGAAILIVKRFFIHKESVEAKVQTSTTVEAKFIALRADLREAINLVDSIAAEDRILGSKKPVGAE